jgi:hypothetical protein
MSRQVWASASSPVDLVEKGANVGDRVCREQVASFGNLPSHPGFVSMVARGLHNLLREARRPAKGSNFELKSQSHERGVSPSTLKHEPMS